ncbi:zonular occludens toxin domain-containing protein [Lysobacter sp. GX 14042]|uniref:zonular occludens toxin domain-containing protein n=1 Tax=Lysobacter sp. GX 14042 TaxID=2907155 RepID=UPI001F15A9F3|nr:zonular occludens toxin domain-containing protein [Lysobacter sp. GX 14042]MCE7031361.1 zonular occludens toxin domain-containing protein [Lysobacter sp. GX 14042]
MSVKALTDEASITLLTGLPGSGKTLRTVAWIKDAIDKGEVVFVSNLNGLKLPHISFEDPRQWEEIPAGSVLVVDEAQQFFRARRGGEVPPYLTAMETIRHKGVRLLLTTQQPDYLDTHLRGLVGKHEHLLRVNGKPAAKIWRHNEVMDNVRSERARARYDSETWDYPPELFPLYESAQVHTVKRTMSARMKRGLVLAALTGVLVLGVGWKFLGFFGGGDAKAQPVSPPAERREARGPVERPASMQRTAADKHEPEAVRDYFANLQPRVGSLPWSAPAYDDRPVIAEPRIFCMDAGRGQDAAGEWVDGGQLCVTEQGTRHVVTEAEARMLARWGEPYNPYRNPDHNRGTAPQPAEPARPVSAPVAVALRSAQVNGYGELGVRANPGP